MCLFETILFIALSSVEHCYFLPLFSFSFCLFLAEKSETADEIVCWEKMHKISSSGFLWLFNRHYELEQDP